MLSEIGQDLSILLRRAACTYPTDSHKIKQLANGLHRKILKHFPWVNITPTLHKVLAHSHQFIAENDDTGLGRKYNEEGQEGCNKLIRRIRQHLTRKNNIFWNITDIIQRMWLKSDPLVALFYARSEPSCKTCNTTGHSTRYCGLHKESSNDDKLFESYDLEFVVN